MTIFLDFDDVVFNTKEFLAVLKKIFKEAGVSEETFLATYQELRDEGNGVGFCYRFDAHVNKLTSVDKETLLARLEEAISNTEDFVFRDVYPFLEGVRQKGYTINILSFGDEHFQAKKIYNTGLGSLVDRIIVTKESKECILQKEGFMANKGDWFFDDRLKFLESMKIAFPLMQTVLVTRAEGRFQEEKTKLCDYQANSLKDALTIL